MSTTFTTTKILLMIWIIIFVLLSFTRTQKGAEAARTLRHHKMPGYVVFKPQLINRGNQQHSAATNVAHVRPEVESCMPKGFRHSSAPSQFVNYHTLGSIICTSSPISHGPTKKP